MSSPRRAPPNRDSLGGPLVLQALGGTQFGGAVAIIASYIRILQARGCRVVVNASVPRVAEALGYGVTEVIAIPELRRPIHPILDLIGFLKFAWLCRQRRFDVVHTHTSKTGVVGRLAARLARVPVVIHTAHGFAFHEGSSKWSIAIYAFIERVAAHACDRIILVSDFHREWALGLGIAPPEKLVTIHNGVTADRVRPQRTREENRRLLNISRHARVIGSFGRLDAQKGLETLIDALPMVLAQERNAFLLVAGDGPLHDELCRRVRRLGLIESALFTGFRTDIADLMSISDVVVSSSIREGLSVSILEAMALGKPIVATNIASNRELLLDGVCGVLVSPANTEELASQIVDLLKNPQRAASVAAQARARFLAEFTEERMQERLWALYTRLLQPESSQ